jgi:AbrB family looped-hinge helix DNA binding protein
MNKGAAEMPLVRVKEKFQVTIPSELRQQARLSVGDYLEAKVDRMGVISLAPKNFVDRRIAEGLDDIKHGRVRGPFDTVEAMLQSLKGTKPAARASKR